MTPHYKASNLFRFILCLNKHYRRDFRFFRSFPKKAFETILDIGAYHGEFTDRVLRHYPIKKVFLFEPLVESVQFLNNKYHSDPRCQIYPFALSNKSGNAYMHILNHRDSSSLLNPSLEASDILNKPFFETKKVEIQKKSLNEISDVCNIPSFDIAKIDVQGAELEVLQGFGDLIHRISSIYIEVNFISLYDRGATFCDTHKFLTELGFNLNFFQEFRRNKEGLLIYANAFYMKS